MAVPINSDRDLLYLVLTVQSGVCKFPHKKATTKFLCDSVIWPQATDCHDNSDVKMQWIMRTQKESGSQGQNNTLNASSSDNVASPNLR